MAVTINEDIEAHVGDVGLLFVATIRDPVTGAVVNVSSATVMTIKLQDPLGVSSSKTASLYTDGVDGKIKYASLAGDLPMAGPWLAQGYVEMPGRKFHTSKLSFPVEDNL